MDAINHYKKFFHRHEEFTNKLCVLFHDLLNHRKINFHVLEKRTKTIRSFEEKIQNKKYVDPYNEVTDLSGIRIILYYQDDINEIIRIIKHEFLIDEPNSSYQNIFQNPNQFGYNSTHIVIQLSSDRAKLPEWNSCINLKAEIQIRTVLQHAWASISHVLQYKSKEDIPPKLQRQLFRLSGLFELADEEFLSIRNRHIDLLNKVNKIKNIENSDINIDLITIEKYLEGSELVLQLFDLALERGFEDDQSVSDDIKSKFVKYSELVTYCHIFNVYKINYLHNILLDNQKGAKFFFDRLLEGNKKRHSEEVAWRIDKEFIIILLLIKEFSSSIKIDTLVENGWSADIAKDVIASAKTK